jgi:glycosyltransferase involved in cell wall biosynthesis
MPHIGSRKTKVLFFAWGDSIHARRRITIFAKDPAFEVGVISTFAYEFENAKNYYLSFSERAMDKIIGMTLLRKIIRRVLSLMIYLIVRCFDKKTTRADCYRWYADVQLVKDYTRQFKPDVIFLQTLLYPCYLSFLLSKRIPTIITFWNGDLTWWAKWNGIERALKKQVVLHGIKRAEAITVNSETAFNACLKYGATKDKVKLIRYPGVNLDLFKPQSNRFELRKQLGLRHEKIVLCTRGLGGYLNSDVIIEAAAMVVKQFPDTLFLFLSGVGSETLWDEHKKRAEELGIVENIRRDGQVPWENMPMYYNAADVVVSISSNDSLPNCMLEAMACGTPLVMGDIPQLREWVTDGVNGLLAPPRDSTAVSHALLRLLDDNGSLVMEFVRYNLALVDREVDSRKSSLLVKQLVHDMAGKHFQEGHT